MSGDCPSSHPAPVTTVCTTPSTLDKKSGEIISARLSLNLILLHSPHVRPIRRTCGVQHGEPSEIKKIPTQTMSPHFFIPVTHLGTRVSAAVPLPCRTTLSRAARVPLVVLPSSPSPCSGSPQNPWWRAPSRTARSERERKTEIDRKKKTESARQREKIRETQGEKHRGREMRHDAPPYWRHTQRLQTRD